MAGILRIVAALVVVGSMTSCRKQDTSNPLLISFPFKRQPHQGKFVRLSSDHTKLDFENNWHLPNSPEYDLKLAMSFGGVALGDYNRDGRLDVYLTRSEGGNRLFRNLGRLRFADVSDQAGVRYDEFRGTGATFVDIDNDGDLDIFACGFDCSNQLFINQGKGDFREEAAAYGLDFNGASVMIGFADYDLDGDLDGYLLTNRSTPNRPFGRITRVKGEWMVPPEDQQYRRIIIDSEGNPQILETGQPDILFRNDGKDQKGQIRFSNVSEVAGIEGNERGQCFRWWDFNGDAAPDLLVINAVGEPSHLYKNNGDGTFDDVAEDMLPFRDLPAVTADTADVDQDGLPDLLVAGNALGETSDNLSNASFHWCGNALVLNGNQDCFGKSLSLPSKSSWNNALFADVDGDGNVDIFATGGLTRDWYNSDLLAESRKLGGRKTASGRHFWSRLTPTKVPNQFFRNLGNAQFEEISADWNMNEPCIGLGAAFGDLDNDGDLDLVLNEFEGFASLYRNDMNDSNNIMLKLRGNASNRLGIGARISIYYKNGSQTSSLDLARGYMSAGDPVVHFGLADANKIDITEIRWPSGIVQTIKDLPANHVHFITEPLQTRETANVTPDRVTGM